MKLIRKTQYKTLTHYFVEWDGLEVWLNISNDNHQTILDSSFTSGSASEKLLYKFCLECK